MSAPTTPPGGATVPAYRAFLPEAFLVEQRRRAVAVADVPGLAVAPGLREAFADVETPEALQLAVDVYHATHETLSQLLQRRVADRAFIDAATAAAVRRSADRDYHDPDYETVIGLRDAEGRVVLGPSGRAVDPPRVVVPEALRGEQVTLFGPPDTAKMSINAMNALHRRRPDEPPLVAELVEASGQVPRWGADSEDSKTPLPEDLLAANRHLVGCAEGTLSFDDPRSGKRYRLSEAGRSLPVKRIPGLALPDAAHLVDGEPLPLHLSDLVLHAFHNRARPEALVYYVPKLESEEEAAYVKLLLTELERGLVAAHPGYKPGTIKLFVVFESPRAIFRIREMAAALAPHFIGGSLGWHDFLASTARALRRDPRYRIPVKADPDIVIRHIKESHQILVNALHPMGALAIGGMYGVLFDDAEPESFQVSMVGYIRDVVTQMKRGLDGFWVAHPDFVRIGIALVEAWRRFARDPADGALRALISELVPDPVELAPLLAFVWGDDVPGLDEADPRYLRGVIAADMQVSELIQNDDPVEVRYNLFQAVQYLTDWLCGNGCVALPAAMKNARGEAVFVRVMDDLATTERSRWELWAEVAHGRVSREDLLAWLEEELAFIRAGEDQPLKRVAVRWEGEAARWYPVAGELLRRLVLDPEPPEFVTELLLPFTLPFVREAEDPWAAVEALCPEVYGPEVYGPEVYGPEVYGPEVSLSKP